MDPALLAVGLGALVGAALALTGAGGGILAMPLLLLGLRLTVTQATPIALMAVGLSAALGAALAFRHGRLRYRAAGLIGISGLISAPLGTWVAHQLPVAALTALFALVLAYVALRMIGEGRHPVPAPSAAAKLPCVIDPEEGRLQWTAPCARALMRTGAVSGALSGALGVGGGFVIVPALHRYTDLATASVVATSLGVIALVSASSVAVAAVSGVVLWSVALPFTLGAALGMGLGSQAAGHLPPALLKQGFGALGLLAAAVLVARLPWP